MLLNQFVASARNVPTEREKGLVHILPTKHSYGTHFYIRDMFRRNIWLVEKINSSVCVP